MSDMFGDNDNDIEFALKKNRIKRERGLIDDCRSINQQLEAATVGKILVLEHEIETLTAERNALKQQRDDLLAGEPTEFKRENKYLVLKLGDIAKFLTRDEQFKLDELIKKIRVGRLNDGKQDQSYVCVASDWPMYEQVWAAVQAFVEGKPSQVDELRQQLAASQLQNTQLRGLLAQFANDLSLTYKQIMSLSAEALALPTDTTALEAMIAKAGEVMRERAATLWLQCSEEEEWNLEEAIRALPGVTIEDLQK